MHAKFEGSGVMFYASDNHDAEPMRGSAHILTMDDRKQTEDQFYRMAIQHRVCSHGGISTGN